MGVVDFAQSNKRACIARRQIMRRLNAFSLASIAGFLVTGCGASHSAYNGNSNDNTMYEATLEQLSLQDLYP